MSTLAVIAACVSLSGANITAGDVAKAIPGFTPTDPAAVMARSPAPGVPRVVHAAELERWMSPQESPQRPQGDQSEDVCFERPVAPLSGEAIVEAMRRALGPEAKIELIEVSKFPAPAGEVVFPRESLGSTGSASGAFWRGFVRYDDDKKFRIWARVRATVHVTRVVAIEALPQGKPIRAAQLKVESSDDAPSTHATVPALENVVGYIPRRTIAANSSVWADAIDPPWEIVKGDTVRIKVHSGLAALTLNVEATSSGRRGEMMAFKNPGSGKAFRAHVDGNKEASIQTDQVKQ